MEVESSSCLLDWALELLSIEFVSCNGQAGVEVEYLWVFGGFWDLLVGNDSEGWKS